MSSYRFDDDTFIIDQYNTQKTFANFLPGVAGQKGIPLWAFYVNRAQGIAGFGLHNKNHPVMLFHSANKAYEHVFSDGFRTFIKVDDMIYEPFISDAFPHRMGIQKEGFYIEETHPTLGIRIKVSYFGMPEMPIAGLYRHVTVENLGKKRTIEILDGLSEVIPAGLSTDAFKSLSNLMVSWMDVVGHDSGYAFYKLRGSTGDSAEMSEHTDGNFYFAYDQEGLIPPISDPALIFETDTSKRTAGGLKKGVQALKEAPQVNVNQIPCAFIPIEMTLDTNETYEWVALSGHVKARSTLDDLLPELSSFKTFHAHQQRNTEIIQQLVGDVVTKTSEPLFDAYVQQNYLDNVLRGGYPITFNDHVYHLYARRHGDLERDYNFFSLAPEYYSTGSGNFRDVCQNRRLEPLFNPDVKDFNVLAFASLIQLDGYNPLAVEGIAYTLNDLSVLKDLGLDPLSYQTFFKTSFTPGSFINEVERLKDSLNGDEAPAIATLLDASTPRFEATFAEGFWSDHFTYFLDLVESYEAVYPDLMQTLLFEESKYPYFDSPVRIKKQHEKTTETKNGYRQYHALEHPDPLKMVDGRSESDTVYTQINGHTYQSNLYTKLLVLALTKLSLLDPDDYGLEMEAGKPGWNDAMNGLPGLFASGVSETIELIRIFRFLKRYPASGAFEVPEEIAYLFNEMKRLPGYDSRVHIRETYRDKIRFGLNGTLKTIHTATINAFTESADSFLTARIDELLLENKGLIPSFLTYEVLEADPYEGGFKPKRFKKDALPYFLEAPARALKLGLGAERARALHTAVKQSELYDKTLKQFKTSVNLDDTPYEIGRVRAFTKGWLERESNFLHMTYKYLLGLLKAGETDAFDEAIQTNLVCFMDPAVYGRSILENSSFIAPTNNPNPHIHGQGFFARLSGSTVEGLHMWSELMMGDRPFTYDKDLTFELFPKLPKRFFKDGKASFTFLGDITVTYHDTVGDGITHTRPQKIVLDDDHDHPILSASVKGARAHDIRNRNIKRIDIYYL